MPQTLDPTSLETPPTPESPPHRTIWTAAEIANACGRSEKWVRNQRQILEWIYYWCPDKLKATDSKSYSSFAFQQIRLLQQAIGNGIPLEKNGQVVTDRKGKAKIKPQKPPQSLQEYAELVWQVNQVEPNFQPFTTPESKAATHPEVPSLEPEVLGEESDHGNTLISEVLIFPETAPLSTIQAADGMNAIAHDLAASLQGFQQLAPQLGRLIGANSGFGAGLLQGLQESANQAMTQAVQSVQPAEVQQVQTKAKQVHSKSTGG
jgi:hypothetical protein